MATTLDRWLLGHLLDNKPSSQEPAARSYRTARQQFDHFVAGRQRPDRAECIKHQEWAAIQSREERSARGVH